MTFAASTTPRTFAELCAVERDERAAPIALLTAALVELADAEEQDAFDAARSALDTFAGEPVNYTTAIALVRLARGRADR